MSPAAVSLLALLVAIVLSVVSRINVGLVAIGMAWLVGVYVAGLGANAVVDGFPSSLFLTLVVTPVVFHIVEASRARWRLQSRAAEVTA